VLHACLLHAVFHHNASLADALQQALPYAAANASHPGIADFPLDDLPRFGGAPHGND
jgi:1-phosphofructokinase/tagatose 6-phosphate kinase